MVRGAWCRAASARATTRSFSYAWRSKWGRRSRARSICGEWVRLIERAPPFIASRRRGHFSGPPPVGPLFQRAGRGRRGLQPGEDAPGLEVGEVEPYEFPELFGCLGQATELDQGDAEVIVRIGVIRLDPQRLATLVDRVLQTPLAEPDIAEIEVCLGRVGIEAKGLVIMGDGLFPPAGFGQGNAEVDLRRDVPRLELQRPPVMLNRLA